MARQLTGVPGNVVGIVAHEVADFDRVPQRFVGFKGQGVQGQLDQCLALTAFHFDMRVGRVPAQHPQRQAVQVFQQLAFPGVPHFWAGATNVRHGEQVQGGQVTFIADPLGESGNHIHVAQVGFLRHMAHGQVFAHHKLDQGRVFACKAVLFAKVQGIFGTQH